jgi:hypothetical protein
MCTGFRFDLILIKIQKKNWIGGLKRRRQQQTNQLFYPKFRSEIERTNKKLFFCQETNLLAF